MLYLIIFFKQYEFCNFLFIKLKRSLITPVYCLIFISLQLPRMSFVYVLKLVDGFEIRNVCLESSFFDTIELHKMGC